MVVTTAAGYPLDTTYYQAIKGLVGALDILRPGGSIILAAECSQGLGSIEFRHMLEDLALFGTYDEFLTHISNPDNFVVDQWEVEMLVKALRKGKIYLFSTGLADDEWPFTFATRVANVTDAVSRALANEACESAIAVIPEGPYVIPQRGLA
ncbi:MAG: hypothetical protein C4532_19780 [Candidatus Abyssobacteria bacterium SURF_17]|uniref:Lactate racemase C-terminal domain-containing protein n=1 Tax=Candidatus Abyssobacteria bacterium SURF_17 TaxID=2093361 RepID=A0A419EMV9_9BACT|nr:MAG: hypothetical protein C4532_19780 [Candidatus Abyssubacteria bacterium SURF_17]